MAPSSFSMEQNGENMQTWGKVKIRNSEELLKGHSVEPQALQLPRDSYPSRRAWTPNSDLALFFSFSLLSNLYGGGGQRGM